MKSAHSLSSTFKIHSESDAFSLRLSRHPSANYHHVLLRSLQKPPDRSVLWPWSLCSLVSWQQPERDFQNIAETMSLLCSQPLIASQLAWSKSQSPCTGLQGPISVFLNLDPMTFGPDNSLCRSRPVHSRCLAACQASTHGVPGAPQPPAVKAKNTFRHCPMSPRE